jgi:isoleucyl-tRNA synthetase
VNYARLDEFDPAADEVPVAERPEIDRWILSNLNALIETAHREMANFNSAGFVKEAARFIDDLSNWYIRRNRRRFWRSRNAGDRDKLAAYQTLYTVRVTLTKLLAPVVPFLAERMYQNLVRPASGETGSSNSPESVHLCDYPQADAALLDPQLSHRMTLAQLVVRLGHGLREQAGQRVRQPLAELRFACSAPGQRAAIEALAEVIQEELNVKQITPCDNLDDLVHYIYKPNLKTLGPRYGKALGAIGKALGSVDTKLLAPLRRGEPVTLSIDGNNYDLTPEDVLVSTRQAADWVAADEDGVQIALSIVLTPELRREGIARDFVRQIQQQRKDSDLDIEDRIRVFYSTDDAEILQAVQVWGEYIQAETLADELLPGLPTPGNARDVLIGEITLPLAIEKV